MKKILSVLISLIMLFSIASLTPVMADSISGTYTFVDTCYSPELGIYVAVAKDLSSGTTPAQIYVSDNGSEWTLTKTLSQAKHYGNPNTRQVVVWWEKEQKFVLAANNKIFISGDGTTWTESTNESMVGSNTTVATNGQILALAAGGTVKVYNSLDDTPPISSDSTAFKLVDKDAVSKTIGLTPSDPMRYAVGDQYKIWYFDAEGTKTTLTSNISAQPYDMEYVEGFNGWVMINGTAVLRILVNDETTKYNNFSAMKLSDGTDNAEKFTSVGVNSDNVVLGTASGKILIAPNDSSSLTVDVPWTIAKAGNGSESNEEIRSISAINDGMFLVASKTKLFMLVNEDDKWVYYDTARDDIVLEDTRFEIPESGIYSETLEPVHYDYKGEISEDAITEFELISDLPDGVISESISDSSAQLIIDSKTVGGHEVKYRATTEKGKSKEFTITIVDEDHIEINGNDTIAIPLEGEDNEEYTYNANIIGTDGQTMNRNVEITIISMPDGLKFNDKTNTFTVNSNVQSGNIVIKASSKSKPQNIQEKTINISKREANKIEFVDVPDSIFIPDDSKKTFSFSAKLYDQIGKEMVGRKIKWSIEPGEISNTDGVSINETTGELTVDSKAVLGTVTVKATDSLNDGIFIQKDVTLQYTDLRMTKEDLSEFEIDTSKPVTENLNLITKGKFESTITWRSSDENIIKTDGTVIRPSREDKKVTITGVAKKNASYAEVKYELIVKKADNLCTNGDLTEDTIQGWFQKDDTVLSIVKDNTENVLKSSGTGAYQVINVTNDSSYGFVAKVKAEKGSGIRITSEKGGVIAEVTATGDYQDIKTSYDYRKQKNLFEDKIYLEYNGELNIKQLKVFEITLELNKVSSAVNKAVYSKASTDISEAKKLVLEFYDLPIRAELLDKLSSITPSSGGNSGGSGGGGGGSSSSSKSTLPENVKNDTGTIAIPPQDKNEIEKTEDDLDTYLLRFKDMKNHWAREDVESMAELGIVNGDENDEFRPEDRVSRAEFATMISKAMGLEMTEYENSFFDVVSDDWYSGYVQAVRSNDYMSGYDGLFKPNADITREEIARVIVAAYNSKTNTKLEKGKSLYFNDLDDISYWAYDYVVEAADMEFIYGITDELFAPKQPATRAQAAVMIKRVYDKLHPTE